MTSSQPTTILVVDDHTVVRQGLCALLEADGRCAVVGQASNGREALELTRSIRANVILMDIAMPVLNGLEATRGILTANPTARVLILSAHSDDAYVKRSIEAGATGFIEKQSPVNLLIKAILEVAKGNSFFSSAVARRLRDDSDLPVGRDGLPRANGNRLTPRESAMLQLVAEGASNKQMAADFGISIKTIEKHRQHLMEKLHIHDTAGLTRYAIAQGVIECSIQVTTE